MAAPITPIRPAEVPTLDDLARDPGRAAWLPGEVRTVLLARALAVVGALAGPMVSGTPAAAPVPAAPEEWITPAEVRHRFGLTPRWCRRHRAALQEARVVSRPPGAKLTLYHVRRLARWIEAHATGPSGGPRGAGSSNRDRPGRRRGPHEAAVRADRS
jgi:hypothetical protein